MTKRGKYIRTPEIREKNRRNARHTPCPDGCTCYKHSITREKCKPDCKCGKHNRTPEHNARIAMSVKLTLKAKRRQR